MQIEALAAPSIVRLDNGLRVSVTPMRHARSVSVSTYVAAGSRFEANEEEAGLSHFLEHLCFKGTERRPRPQQISVEIDAMGGNMNAATNRELTVYYAKMTPEHAPQAIGLMADLLRNSLLEDGEIERERNVILEELAAVADSPTEQVGVLLDEVLWPGQPHGRDIAGSASSVAAMPNDRIRDYYRRQYVANATVVSIAGAIDVDEAIGLVTREFGSWEPGDPLALVPHRDEPHGPRVRVIEKELEQIHVTLGMRSISVHDDDRFALDLLSIILGEGMSSRLFSRLREELGLCYDIHSYMAAMADTGMFGVYSGVDEDRALKAVREIARELRRTNDPVSEEELTHAKLVARSRTHLRMEDTRAVSALYGSQAILGLPQRTPEEFLELSAAVTVEDVMRVAQRVITPDAIQIAAVGEIDAADLEAAMQAGC
ncbi:MAG: insulinase family protein [Chloroflexi bacterium]|nr:pitrilysin family protein [Chloroflexota bacterium]MQC18232.1 insulinase family protein [Chloroflexota bacterium]